MAVTAFAAMSCGNNQPEHEVVPGINLENLDTTVAPGDDFYAYATGGWQKSHPLKPEYSRYGAFEVLNENSEIRLNELFEGLATAKTKKGTEGQKIADLYTMGLDSLRLNSEGAAPVKPYLAALESVVDMESFAKASAEMAAYGAGSMFSSYVGSDMMNSNWNVLYIGESDLAMGNRDYYLLPEHAALRDGYKAFLENVFTLAGEADAAQKAQDAFDVEMAIAEPFWSMEQQRNVAAQYNPMSSEELFAAYPALHFDTYFATLGIENQEKLIVEEPSYFEAINAMFSDADAAKLRHFLQAKLLSSACNYMSDEFSDARFDFFSKQMAGVQEQKPRWKRAMQIPNSALGEAVGKLYVAKYFSENDKERMLTIVRNIQKSLGQHVDELEWMSDETKAKAREKLESFTVKIGYPDNWKDYSALTIDPSRSYYENIRAVSAWRNQEDIKKIGKEVDREEWHMSPQTVNAYYNPTTNEICFPAGILQPPFYNSDADDAVNYGAIGVVISHEMTHGFDDQGRLFDKDGNMNNWWTEADEEAFTERSQVLIDQFNQVEILPGLMANGVATLGENIADHGGLRIAYTAMENSFGGKRPEPIDGFTPEQRFYLAYATLWGQNVTDQEKTRRTLTDVHSLGENRVNVSVRNLDTFFEAFGIKEGDPMFRPEDERVIIW